MAAFDVLSLEGVTGDRAFPAFRPGKGVSMIGLGIALVVIGIILLFILPWVGIPLGIVGLVLAILWFAGLIRARGGQPGDSGM